MFIRTETEQEAAAWKAWQRANSAAELSDEDLRLVDAVYRRADGEQIERGWRGLIDDRGWTDVLLELQRR